MIRKGLYIGILLFLSVSLFAEQKTFRVDADNPGVGTGTNVLPFGFIQWESAIGVDHIPGTHFLVFPATLFRFGLHDRVELRTEFAGSFQIHDRPNSDPETQNGDLYYVDPLYIGTKIKLWGGSNEAKLKWIPRVSAMFNLGLPLTKSAAKTMPVSGMADLLFENDITKWLTLRYNFGVHWLEWAPMPDFFTSVCLDFSITDKWGISIENFNYFDCDSEVGNSGRSTDYNINMNFAVTYRPIPTVQLDFGGGFNCYTTHSALSGPRNHAFVGIDITWLVHTPK